MNINPNGRLIITPEDIKVLWSNFSAEDLCDLLNHRTDLDELRDKVIRGRQ